MTNGLMRRLAVAANKCMELDADSRKAELFARSTIGADAVARETSQLFNLFFRCFT